MPSILGGNRRWLRTAHLYLGLTIGALFVVTGLTGSLLVFYLKIDAWFNPAVRVAAAAARPASYEAVYLALRAAYPQRSAHWQIEIPDDGGVIQSRSEAAADIAQDNFAPLLVWLDPRDLKIIRADRWGHFAMTWIYDLHYRLLMGKTGAVLMGCAGLLVLAQLISGLLTWWPARWRDLKYALGVRGSKQLSTRLYHIHKLTGLTGFAVLIVIAATGVMLSLPAQVHAVLASVSSLDVEPTPQSVQSAGAQRLSVDRAIAGTAARFPSAPLKWIETPGGPSDVYAFSFRVAGEPNRRFPTSTVWVDQYSGRVLATRDARRLGRASTVLDWLYPLHDGEAFDLPGRIVALLAGTLPAVLFATGIWRWRLRRVKGSKATRAAGVRSV